MTCGPGSPGTLRLPWSPGWRRCGPGPATSPATPPGSRCASWAGAREFLDGQLERLDELIVPLVTARAPGLLAVYGVGPDTAACCWSRPGTTPDGCVTRPPGRTCARVAPIPASSGKVTRHRLNPGGDRQANHALWRIVITRMGSHPPTRAYVERRTAEGLSKKEIIRCLKRYVAREVYPHLRPAGG